MWLKVEHIDVKYDGISVINDLSFELTEKQTLAVLGKSGCGKTTLLKTISGLISPTAGKVYLMEEDLEGIPANRRNIIYLNQEALLFPHLNVYENIAFGLKIRKEDSESIRNSVMQMLDNLDLLGYEHKMPNQLSGGQRQRVSFGRALILNPKVLLLDEPFASLDAQTRGRMQTFYRAMAEKYCITSVFVTHDVKEAMLMGDAIGLMDKGKLELFDSKDDFIRDERTGVKQEIEFWNTIKDISDA